jgi:bacteriocin biosynthesis cyclodehydratase domain-containing protein
MQRSNESARPVHVVSVGPFGHAVMRHLELFRHDIVPAIWGGAADLDRSELFSNARINVLAAWRPVPAICQLLDRICHSSRIPFVPLILDSRILRLGPVIVPGGASCWDCWDRRYKQHDSWRKEYSALMQYYTAAEVSGPVGYLEPFAVIGATVISRVIGSLDSGTATAGYVWQMDVLTRHMTTSISAGIHNCPCCGLHRSAPTRSFEEMQKDLSYIWEHGSSRKY